MRLHGPVGHVGPTYSSVASIVPWGRRCASVSFIARRRRFVFMIGADFLIAG